MRRHNRGNKGFTLVEVIVVLVILAILAAIMVPAMTGWIDKARQKQIVIACRTCVTAAQTLASEQYGIDGSDNINVTPAQVLDLAKIAGSVSAIDIDKPTALVEHLRYTDTATGESVLYCRSAADGHATHYNFGTGIASDGRDWMGTIKTAAKNALNKNVNVDSGAPQGITANNYGNYTKQTLEAMMTLLGGKNAATALATANVQSWAVRSDSGEKNILMSDRDVNDAKVGDIVRVIRYDALANQYSVGYVAVSSNTITDTSGTKYTYNTLSPSKQPASKYFTESSTCTDYNDALAKFAAMPLQPVTP